MANPARGGAQDQVGVPPVTTARDSALHVLNRLAYGPRPGDAERVAAFGVWRWIDDQLAGVPDPALSQRESEFAILGYDTAALARALREQRRQRRESKTDPAAAPDAEDSYARLRGELQQLALVRAVTAENQLREVLSDFWFNHFNVFLGKGADRFLLPDYVERVIRQYALGRFEDLLIATAESPAMLFYLDNVQSVATGATSPRLRRAEERAARGTLTPEQAARLETMRSRLPKGLNENYARELLELHTLGVDGGYTQQDVIDVARILTGWGMQPPERGAGFEYHEWAHDRGEKHVLGETFPAGGGREEGIRLLGLLANHPATVRHVSRRLVMRFVADDPPDGCVDAAVAAWERSGGEIREVVRAILDTPEFWASAGGKFKTPLEFTASAVRAVDAGVDSTPRLVRVVARLGQAPYMQPVPTGYPEEGAHWVNSGSLLQRMNVAIALGAGNLPGVSADLDRVVPLCADPAHLVDGVNARLLGGAMSANTQRVILEQIRDAPNPKRARALAVGLALGGPEFQRQ
jgi:uncharacterized protein (DUF1800 family)